MPVAGVMEPADFIRTRFALAPLSFAPAISLYRPTPKSGLVAWLAAQDRADDPPYWAYAWAGGAALALYLAENPQIVCGKSVLDFGAGSGLVGLAAARAGAKVTAFEPDPLGRAATRLNAEANAVDITVIDTPIKADVILAGDVFYDALVSHETLPVLTELAQTATVLVGDPFRRDLPRERLELLAEYSVPDLGSDALVPAGVFALHP